MRSCATHVVHARAEELWSVPWVNVVMPGDWSSIPVVKQLLLAPNPTIVLEVRAQPHPRSPLPVRFASLHFTSFERLTCLLVNTSSRSHTVYGSLFAHNQNPHLEVRVMHWCFYSIAQLHLLPPPFAGCRVTLSKKDYSSITLEHV